MTHQLQVKLLSPTFSSWQPKKEPDKQIAVLMSGGVDSSVAAHLLKEQGWDVLGITMKIPVACNTGKRGCCGADAAFVCNELNIPHYFVDVTEAFEELIIKHFRQSYAEGRTPNPCVDCNTSLKFSLLWDFLEETFDIKYLATGHYARVSTINAQVRLSRANDKTKDQSYFLYGIASDKLTKLVLPLGELTKSEVRSIASNLNRTVANKAESMELCFAGESDYRATLAAGQANRPGDITDMQSNKIGTHKGIANYTLGQRRGIGFAGGKPLYVGKINAQTNTIALGAKEEVVSISVTADQINILIPEKLIEDGRLFGKIRSYGDPWPCRLTGVNKTRMTIQFDQPQFAPCPGQRLVLYDLNDNVVAGGIISAETMI
ncbi:MAG: tRNA 2-thiouridine(34) synthase MnmA [Planctomycetota bacterium]